MPARSISCPPTFTVAHPLLVSASDDVMAFTETIIPSRHAACSVNLDGKDLRDLGSDAPAHNWPRVSPDGRLLARQHIDATRSQPDIWIEDLERGTVYPVLKTLEPDMSPVWSPDGRQLAFVTGHLPLRQGKLTLNIVAADGTGIVRSLQCPGDYCEPIDWSVDGSTLCSRVLESGNENVWTISGPRTGGVTRPLLAAEYDGAGRAVLAGRAMGCLRVGGSRSAGSAGTRRHRPGEAIHWCPAKAAPSRYGAGTGRCSISSICRVTCAASRCAGRRTGEPVFGLPGRPDLPQVGFGHWGTQYDISPDGSRIYFMQPTEVPSPREIQVAINWQALLD